MGIETADRICFTGITYKQDLDAHKEAITQKAKEWFA
jgi:hypothetical protein